MFQIKFIALIVSLLNLAYATDFHICSGSKDLLGLKTVTLEPPEPIPHHDLHIKIAGHSHVDILNGSSVDVKSKIYGIVVSDLILDLCSMITCPVHKDKDYSFEIIYKVPYTVPISATVDVLIKDHSGLTMTCLEMAIRIQDHNLINLYKKWSFQYADYVMKHNLKTSFEIFKKNYKLIERHNNDPTKTYKLELNQFAGIQFVNGLMKYKTNSKLLHSKTVDVNECKVCNDLCDVVVDETCTYMCSTDECVHECSKVSEDVCILACEHVCHQIDNQEFCQEFNKIKDVLPEYINYNELGYMTPVRDQGQCGSCFAMSAVEAIESSYYKKMNQQVILSVQQVVSCDTEDMGCGGGIMDNVFDWSSKNGGLCNESDYPYVSGRSHVSGICQPCTVEPNTKPLHIIDIAHDEESLKTALVNLGPLSVAIEADQDVFRFYKSGVISGPCGARLNHGVLLVGYGHDNETGLDYWLLKNSWSAGWGMDGYVKIERNKKTWSKVGQCGISSEASYPVL